MTVHEPSEPLIAPVLVAAFDGWIDAAGAATGAAGQLVKQAGRVTTLASFEGDLLFDYRSRRPILDVVDGKLSELTWFDLEIRQLRVGGRDVLVLAGAEPDFRWRQLAAEIADHALRWGITEWVSLGAIPNAVAHTRPVPVLGTASREGLLPPDVQQGPLGLLRVPAAALSVIEMAVVRAGIASLGFFAHVPHYVGGPYAAASIALLEHLGKHLGVAISMGDLPEEAMSQRERIDKAVASDEDATDYLRRLEEAPAVQEQMPSGDDLASEIERFLRGESGPTS
jgi:hypothetical protein